MDTLRTLAENTDGRAIVNRNDLAVGMKQIMRDTSAYYLLGYNSTQAPSDGKFHEIKVRVKRPGVQVRARKGYWALNREEVARATGAAQAGAAQAGRGRARRRSPRPSRASVVRTWIGTSRGENGKTSVTFVWEPMPKAPGDRAARGAGARVADGDRAGRRAVLPRQVPDALRRVRRADGRPPAARPQRVYVRRRPRARCSCACRSKGAASQVLDTETREIAVPDLTSAAGDARHAARCSARARAREFQQLKADADAVPIAAREFSRTDRLLDPRAGLRPGRHGAGARACTC